MLMDNILPLTQNKHQTNKQMTRSDNLLLFQNIRLIYWYIVSLAILFGKLIEISKIDAI